MRFLYDFYRLYAIACIMRAGGNVYDVSLLERELLRTDWDPTETAFGMPYPPWTLPFFYVFGFLPFYTALAVCFGLSIVLLLLIVALSYKVSCLGNLSSRACTVKQRLVYLALFFPLFKVLLYGQPTFIALLGLTLFSYLIFHRKPFSAGLALSLCSLKPQLLVPFFVVVLIWELKQHRLLVINGLLMGVILQILIALIIVPDSFSQYLEFLPSFMTSSAQLSYPTLTQLFKQLTGIAASPYILLIPGLLTAMWIAFRFDFSFRLLYLLVLPLSVLVAPYSWSHDFAFLLLPYILICEHFFQRISPLRIALLLLPLFATSIYLMGPPQEMYMIWLPLAIFVLSLFVLNNQTRERSNAL
ncbi:MAG: DUF2029 domain-containing protein [SAR324 cluster bacterium]|uniref:DUF2029 domain-containing protein n=1 Tax=SAR324 cluster bacterium TaxID=2024889 RepID=A0A7X9FU48_9DELT|nr:DUF2029 domain-containing protein [SAR324 cluster bacterium]